MATAAAGPIQAIMRSSAAQYAIVLGIGVYAAFGPERAMELFQVTLQNLAQPQNGQPRNTPVAPIIIHHNGSGVDGKQGMGIFNIVQYGVGLYALYAGTQGLLQFVPEQIQQLMPVSGKVFSAATKNLAKAVLHVKETLGEKLRQVLEKQDELANKQEETGRDVKTVMVDVKSARDELSDLSTLVKRCEDSLDDTHRLQNYTARGVSLLVRVVQSIMPGDDRMAKELRDYQQDGDILRRLTEAVGSRSDHPVPSLPQVSSKPGFDLTRELYQSHDAVVEPASERNTKNSNVIRPRNVSPEDEHPIYYHRSEEQAGVLSSQDDDTRILQGLLQGF